MKKFIITLCSLAIALSVQAADFCKGTLPNGLTYYIIHNENPSGVADFYIAHNVGALEEEDNQDGLAHFLEHLAFNGLKHFPDKEMLSYLARNGVRFGYNVNAYTSRYETVYNIDSVPVAREALVDSVLLVIRDWADGISCETAAVQAEAGVINEEWRLRFSDQRRRMMFQQDALIYGDSKQGRRTVLGNMDVINSATGETLLDFYHSWYRPDLQAVIVVGDVDEAEMKSKIESLFADLKSPEGAREKVAHPLDPIPAVKAGVMSDPDVNSMYVKIMHHVPIPPVAERASYEALKEEMVLQAVSSAIYARFKDRQKDDDCPYTSAVSVTSQQGREVYLNLLTISLKQGHSLEDLIISARREIERLLRFGITDEELAAIKFDLLKSRRLVTIEQGSDTNADLVKICLNNFLRGLPLVKTPQLKELQKGIVLSITREEIEAMAARLYGTNGIYASCMNSAKTSLAVSQERVLAIIDSVRTAPLEPRPCKYDNMSLDVTLSPGQIKSSRQLKEGVREWTLGNGAKVYFLRCDSLKRTSRVSAKYVFENGGVTALDLSEKSRAKYAIHYIDKNTGMRGVGKHSLMQQPALVETSVIMHIDKRKSTISTSSSNLEDAFKVAAIQITEPYFGTPGDLKSMNARALKQASEPKSPKSDFNTDILGLVEPESPLRGVEIDSAAVKALDFDFLAECYDRAYGDISGMSVYIVSDYSEDEIKACVEKYIASLPSKGPRPAVRKPAMAPAPGRLTTIERTEPSGEGAPLAIVSYNALADVKAGSKTDVTIQLLDYIMSDRCLNKIREERGGTYHVAFNTLAYPLMREGSKKMFRERLVSSVDFQTRVELRDILLQDTKDIIAEMALHGPTSAEIDEAVKYFTKRYNMRKVTVATTAAFRMDALLEFIGYGRSMDNSDYLKVLGSVTAADIQALASRIAKGSKVIATYTEE